MTARPVGALALDLLRAAHSDLTTGEALMPEQQDSIADAVSDADVDLRALIAERDELSAQRDALKSQAEDAEKMANALAELMLAVSESLDLISEADVPPGHVCYLSKATMCSGIKRVAQRIDEALAAYRAATEGRVAK